MYSDNAMYGEMSNQQKTQAKLDAQDGVKAAVDIDAMEASQKASEQKGATEKKQQEAEKLAGETIGKTAADILENTAAALAAGKLASDHASTSKYNSIDQYAEAQAQKASSQASVDKTRLEKSEDQEITQKKLDAMREGAHDKELFDQQAIAAGIAKRDNQGNLIATKGSQFTDGLSALGAGDMASTSQLIIGGERLNVDTDLDGNAFVNRDSSENVKRGRDSQYGLTGYAEHLFGTAGEAAMFGLGGVGLAEGLSRKAGMKDGIVKPIGKASLNKAAEILGFEKPFGSEPDETSGKTDNSNNNKTSDSPENKSKNGVHNDSLSKDTKSIAEKAELGQVQKGSVKPQPDIMGESKPSLSRLSGAPGTISESGWLSRVMNNPRARIGGEILGRGLSGLDAITSGSQAINDFKTGDNSSGVFNTVQSATAAAFTVKPSPVTGAAYAVSTVATTVKSAGDYLYKNADTQYRGNAPLAAGIDPYVPKHAQTAFSTPRGFNTMSAMGGKSVYGDMTDVKNVGASIHIKQRGFIIYEKIQSRSKL